MCFEIYSRNKYQFKEKYHILIIKGMKNITFI